MLKILDFNAKVFNYSKSEFNLDNYHAFIEETLTTPVVYNFTKFTSIVVHLVDNDGTVHHAITLDFTCDEKANRILVENSYNEIEEYIVKLISAYNQIDTNNNDIVFMLYVGKQYVHNVDIEYKAMCMKSSLVELIKMYRDITWFK